MICTLQNLYDSTSMMNIQSANTSWIYSRNALSVLALIYTVNTTELISGSKQINTERQKPETQGQSRFSHARILTEALYLSHMPISSTGNTDAKKHGVKLQNYAICPEQQFSDRRNSGSQSWNDI